MSIYTIQYETEVALLHRGGNELLKKWSQDNRSPKGAKTSSRKTENLHVMLDDIKSENHYIQRY